MSFLLPSVEGDAKLAFAEDAGTGNDFLLSKEEELARVTKEAALKTTDKQHAHTRYSLHNIAVRAAAGDREKAVKSLDEKIKECAAWKVRRRSKGREGVAVCVCLKMFSGSHHAATFVVIYFSNVELFL